MEEICVKLSSYSQSLTHSSYDSAESIAPDSDLEDEQIRKMLASPLYIRERKENEGQARAYHSKREKIKTQSSRNPEASRKFDAECVQKREANAQRTQAYHSRRESLMTSSSRGSEASGKLDAMFSCHSESSQNTFSERNRRNESGNRFNKITKTMHACIVEAPESASYRKFMKITSQAKGKFDDSLQHGSQVSSCASSDENSRCESISGQGMEETRNNSSLAVGQSKEQKRRSF